MKITVDLESSVPIYIQIEDSITSLINAGQLQPGDQLPTIRELAADIRVNLNTVAKAYHELDIQGVITTQRGIGTFVSGVPDQKQIEKTREKLLQSIIISSLEEAYGLGYTSTEIQDAFLKEIELWLKKTE